MIIKKAEDLPIGIHLALGSFAVYVKDKGVINVTPFIVCGKPCQANYIVKNATSHIDVTYQDDTGLTITSLDAYEIDNLDLPKLSIFNQNYDLNFNNVITCTSPLGKPFKTVIDICLDHNKGVGIKNISSLALAEKDVLSQPVSHIVLSNTTSLQESNSIGSVMQNDPVDTKNHSKNIEETILSPVSFGKASVDIFKFKMRKCHILQDSLINRKSSIESFYNSLLKTDFNFIKFNQKIKLLEELRVSDDDLYMENLILDAKERVYLNDRPISLTQEIESVLQDSEKHKQVLYLYKLLSDYESFLEAGYAAPLQDIGKVIIKTTLADRKLEKYTDIYNKYFLSIANGVDLNKVRDYFNEKVHELEELCLDINKEEMQKFISLERGKFESPNSVYSKLEQLRYIENTITGYAKNKPIIEKIQAISREYQENATVFTIGMKRKSIRIENALKSMPIEETCNFVDTNQLSHPVFQALASHRITGKVYLKNDKIDEQKAVSKFRKFSKQVKEILENGDKALKIEFPKKPNKI